MLGFVNHVHITLLSSPGQEVLLSIRTDSLEKTLMLGKIEDERRMGWQRMRWSDSLSDSMDMKLSKFQEIVEDRGAW